MNRILRVLKETEEGINKLDAREYWTSNSSGWSLICLSLFLFTLSIISLFIDLFYDLKRKTYWRWKFRKI